MEKDYTFLPVIPQERFQGAICAWAKKNLPFLNLELYQNSTLSREVLFCRKIYNVLDQIISMYSVGIYSAEESNVVIRNFLDEAFVIDTPIDPDNPLYESYKEIYRQVHTWALDQGMLGSILIEGIFPFEKETLEKLVKTGVAYNGTYRNILDLSKIENIKFLMDILIEKLSKQTPGQFKAKGFNHVKESISGTLMELKRSVTDPETIKVIEQYIEKKDLVNEMMHSYFDDELNCI